MFGKKKHEEEIELDSPYAVDKYCMEKYAQVANKLYGIPSIGLRFFNVYGPRQNPQNPYSGVISIFIDRIMADLSVTVNGGYQTRDFIYVKDISAAMIRSMEVLQSQVRPSP